MNLPKKISVICPVYNTDKYLQRCLDSILNQTFKDFELILVYDVSTDKSGEICLQYVQKDDRVKFICLEKKLGISHARNEGVQNASGDYIAWVDSDDWVDEDWLEIMYNLMEFHSAEIVIIGTRNRKDDKAVSVKDDSSVNILEFNTEEALNCLVDDKYINSGLMDKLYRKEVLSDILFPVGRTFEDAAVMHLLLSNAKRIVYSNIKKYNYFFRVGSLSHRYLIRNEYDRFLAHRDRFDFFSKIENEELLRKEVVIVFTYSLKVQQMGLFRKKTNDEEIMMEEAFNWTRLFLKSKWSNLLPNKIVGKFYFIHGSFLSKAYIFLRFEFKIRLKYFILEYVPLAIITPLKNIKNFLC
jgi:glycosyltransferase involved in cell wall biosynthesis